MSNVKTILLASLLLSACRIQDGLDGRADGRGSIVVERAEYSASNIPNSVTLSIDLRVRNKTDETAQVIVCSITINKTDLKTGDTDRLVGGQCGGSDAARSRPTRAPHSDTVIVRQYTIPTTAVPVGTRLLASVGLAFAPEFTDAGYFISGSFVPTGQ